MLRPTLVVCTCIPISVSLLSFGVLVLLLLPAITGLAVMGACTMCSRTSMTTGLPPRLLAQGRVHARGHCGVRLLCGQGGDATDGGACVVALLQLPDLLD